MCLVLVLVHAYNLHLLTFIYNDWVFILELGTHVQNYKIVVYTLYFRILNIKLNYI